MPCVYSLAQARDALLNVTYIFQTVSSILRISAIQINIPALTDAT